MNAFVLLIRVIGGSLFPVKTIVYACFQSAGGYLFEQAAIVGVVLEGHVFPHPAVRQRDITAVDEEGRDLLLNLAANRFFIPER